MLIKHACPLPQSAAVVHAVVVHFPHESHTLLPSIPVWHAEYCV